jgi:hypothetical protein
VTAREQAAERFAVQEALRSRGTVCSPEALRGRAGALTDRLTEQELLAIEPAGHLLLHDIESRQERHVRCVTLDPMDSHIFALAGLSYTICESVSYPVRSVSAHRNGTAGGLYFAATQLNRERRSRRARLSTLCRASAISLRTSTSTTPKVAAVFVERPHSSCTSDIERRAPFAS